MTRKVKHGSNPYSRVHYWMKVNYGKPKYCEGKDCPGVSKIYDWAVKNECDYEPKRENFLRLCRSCHTKYDMTPEKKKRIFLISHTEEANRKKSERRMGYVFSKDVKLKIKELQRAKHRNHCIGDLCLSIPEWAERTGIGKSNLKSRLYTYNYTIEEAINHKLKYNYTKPRVKPPQKKKVNSTLLESKN